MKAILTYLFLSFLILAAGFSQQQSLTDRFKRLDKDGDGKLSSTELPAPAFFQRLDKNKDGWVTPDEITVMQGQAQRRIPDGVAAHRDLVYAEVDGQPLKLDLFLPPTAEEKPPLLVWIHGGGWTKGSKEQFNPVFLQLTGEGYATASIDYRLEGLQSHPKQIHDGKAAIRWLRAHAQEYGYDISRIGIGGGSAGGHLSLLLGVTSGVPEMEGEVGGNLDQSSAVNAIVDLFGPVTVARIEKASPLRYLDAGDPPVIIFHGDQDRLVPLSESELLHARYQELGLESSLHVIEGAGHGGMAFSDQTRYALVKAFLDRHLKGASSNTGESAKAIKDEVQAHEKPQPDAGETVQASSTENLDLAYGKHPSQKLDLYQPADAKAAPVMVYVHGGGWKRGDKRAVGEKVNYFGGRGWLFASVNYRLIPEGSHPNNVNDVARALAWVHDHAAEYGGNPDQIFLMGHSAGAHLAALVATSEKPLKEAGKSLAILRGVIPLDTNGYNLPELMQARPVSLYSAVFGDDPAVWKDASPFDHVAAGKGIPPFLICFSKGMGRVVSPERSKFAGAFAEKLRSAGISAEVVDASDRNHGEINQWFGRADDEKVTGKAQAFLDAILDEKGEKPPSNL